MRKLIIFFSALLFMSAAYVNQLFYVPVNWPAPVYNFKNNPITKEKAELGRILFYDPILSGNQMISCASCHSPYNAFTHIDHSLSHGINDKIGTRNSPALMNLAWQKMFMWDGAINHLDMQALAPITHPDEMGSSIDSVIAKLQSKLRYRQLFYNAFGDSVITTERTLKSLSQFMLTLISSNSKYDKVMRNETGFSFNENEQKGYVLFKQHCAVCHTEPLFTNNGFENNGLETDSFLKDIGRMKVTGNINDSLKFKVPTLRNCELTSPYMHDGRFRNLQMVLFHYTNTVSHTPTLSKHLQKMPVFTEIEKGSIISFLKTLTDEEFIKNTNHTFLK
ncbi:MAG: cytochrome-c peroxidase [Bacteroidia bacterium]|nr:cytochrome-c peroxidase [Bacteroidia bacterium]